jgi:diacylglycerol kinase (ATP)
MTRVAVVVHEAKAEAAGAGDPRPLLLEAVRAAGWPTPDVFPTTEDDPGGGLTEQAIANGAELVVVCGGDGTVSACAAALAGTGVPLALLPVGTGNLIAGNFGVPTELGEAVETAISGVDWAVDVGRVRGEAAGSAASQAPDDSTAPTSERVVVGLGGVGLDAAMVGDAPKRLKAKLGWPAYVVSLVRHLADRGFDIDLAVDGEHRRLRGVRTVLVGNVGALHGGITVLPEARPDDGLLHVAVLAPRGLFGWLSVILRLLRHRQGAGRGRMLRRFQGRHVVITCARPVRREIDGEVMPDGAALTVAVDPGALLVRVPRDRASSA